MKTAAIYDIHGNLPALEAVLAEIHGERVDQIVVGGDVLPGPMPGECLELLFGLKISTHFIMGNGDRTVLEQKGGREPTHLPEFVREFIKHSARKITPKQAEAIAAWPKTLQLDCDLGPVLFCHATPRNDTEIFVKSTAEAKLEPIFSATRANVVVCGHTHMQFDRMVGDLRVVNAGSVGMPFGEPAAYWLMLEADVKLRRTNYDLHHAASTFRKTDYPEVEKFIANELLNPKTEAEMLGLFSKAELN